jgi:adenylate cyclase
MDNADDDARTLKSEVAAAQRIIDDLNARLRQKTSQLQIIQTIASDINTTLDLERIFHISLEAMDTLFGFRHAMITFADDATQSLEVVASRGYDGAGIGARVPYGKGVLGVVAKKRKLLRMVNLRAAMMYAKAAGGAPGAIALPGLANAQSQIALPLVVKDRLIGVYAVESADANAFDAIDEVILNILAQQLTSRAFGALPWIWPFNRASVLATRFARRGIRPIRRFETRPFAAAISRRT